MKDLYTNSIELQNDIANAKKAFSLLEDAGLPARMQYELQNWIKTKEAALKVLEDKLDEISI